jgi:hypothetical protein
MTAHGVALLIAIAACDAGKPAPPTVDECGAALAIWRKHPIDRDHMLAAAYFLQHREHVNRCTQPQRDELVAIALTRLDDETLIPDAIPIRVDSLASVILGNATDRSFRLIRPPDDHQTARAGAITDAESRLARIQWRAWAAHQPEPPEAEAERLELAALDYIEAYAKDLTDLTAVKRRARLRSNVDVCIGDGAEPECMPGFVAEVVPPKELAQRQADARANVLASRLVRACFTSGTTAHVDVTCNTLCVRASKIDPRIDECLDDALVLVRVPDGSFAFAIDLP